MSNQFYERNKEEAKSHKLKCILQSEGKERKNIENEGLIDRKLEGLEKVILDSKWNVVPTIEKNTTKTKKWVTPRVRIFAAKTRSIFFPI